MLPMQISVSKFYFEGSEMTVGAGVVCYECCEKLMVVFL